MKTEGTVATIALGFVLVVVLCAGGFGQYMRCAGYCEAKGYAESKVVEGGCECLEHEAVWVRP